MTLPGYKIALRIMLLLVGIPAGSPIAADDVSALHFDTVAHRILKLEAAVRPVDPAMVQTLDSVVASACSAIRQLKLKRSGSWDRRYAEAVLRCVDSTLIAHGFVYPESGGVDLLADGLKPFQMDAGRRRFLESQPHNFRRAQMISERFPGPFHSADCDVASFIYLAVAGQMNLPLHLVMIPSHNRNPGHTFVRWREGARYLNWETTDGVVRSDEDYIRQWKVRTAVIEAGSAMVDLSADQVLGSVHYLLAVQHERRMNHKMAREELHQALELYPQNLDVRREFAWVTATAADLPARDDAAAIRSALHVLNLVEDPDTRDTLAAAYASAGIYDLAVKEEKVALSSSSISRQSRAAYKQRLNLYLHNVPYRHGRPDPDAR